MIPICVGDVHGLDTGLFFHDTGHVPGDPDLRLRREPGVADIGLRRAGASYLYDSNMHCQGWSGWYCDSAERLTERGSIESHPAAK